MNSRRMSAWGAGMSLLAAAASAVGSPLDQLEVYRSQGVEQTDAARGRQLWFTAVAGRSCSDCHGESPSVAGKHVKTGKEIEEFSNLKLREILK